MTKTIDDRVQCLHKAIKRGNSEEMSKSEAIKNYVNTVRVCIKSGSLLINAPNCLSTVK